LSPSEKSPLIRISPGISPAASMALFPAAEETYLSPASKGRAMNGIEDIIEKIAVRILKRIKINMLTPGSPVKMPIINVI
jgi:hypothetical protein